MFALSGKTHLHLSKTLRFLSTFYFINYFWLSQPSQAELSVASFLGELCSETRHLPASHIGLPLSLSLVRSGHLMSHSDMNCGRLRHYAGRKQISGRRGTGPFEIPGVICIYKDVCNYFPSCSPARLCYCITCCIPWVYSEVHEEMRKASPQCPHPSVQP